MSTRDERRSAPPSHRPPEAEHQPAGQESFQGGAGGPNSNTGPYAGAQPYGAEGDQLGHGSPPEKTEEEAPADPALTDDFATWRRTGGTR